MSFAFSKENLKKIDGILKQYPENRRQSALLPILDLAQRQNGGWLSFDVLEAIANLMGIPTLKVQEVASFYTMFHLQPVGKFHVQICGTTPCWLRGAENIMHTCKKHLGLEHTDITEDAMFSIEEVECLGACVNAPVVQINDHYFEDLDEKSLITLLDTCKEKGLPKPYSAQNRQGSAPLSLKREVR